MFWGQGEGLGLGVQDLGFGSCGLAFSGLGLHGWCLGCVFAGFRSMLFF